MKSVIVIKEYKSFKKVTYYALQYEEHNESEPNKFFRKLENEVDYEEDITNLVQWLIEIGENRGAKQYLFRIEEAAEALPPPAKQMKVLELDVEEIRLYCIRINDNVVILGNGGIKTTNKAQDCPNCGPHFRLINSIARQLNRKISDGEFIISGKLIKDIDSIFFEC